MQSVIREVLAVGVAVLVCLSVSATYADGLDPYDPFNPKWEEDIAAFESFEIGGAPLDLLSGGNALVSKAKAFEGATGLVGDPSGFGFTVDLSGDYLFDFDEYTLKPEAQAALEDVMELYVEYEGTTIDIEGHTDSKGSDAYNQELSEKRAESVREWFLERQIDSSLLKARGLGETAPVAPNTTGGADNPDGRALNRRVEITVTTLKLINHLPIVTGGD